MTKISIGDRVRLLYLIPGLDVRQVFVVESIRTMGGRGLAHGRSEPLYRVMAVPTAGVVSHRDGAEVPAFVARGGALVNTATMSPSIYTTQRIDEEYGSIELDTAPDGRVRRTTWDLDGNVLDNSGWLERG